MSKDTRAQEIADTINTLRDWASHRDRTAFHACYREAVRSPELVLALRRRLGRKRSTVTP